MLAECCLAGEEAAYLLLEPAGCPGLCFNEVDAAGVLRSPAVGFDLCGRGGREGWIMGCDVVVEVVVGEEIDLVAGETGIGLVGTEVVAAIEGVSGDGEGWLAVVVTEELAVVGSRREAELVVSVLEKEVALEGAPDVARMEVGGTGVDVPFEGLPAMDDGVVQEQDVLGACVGGGLSLKGGGGVVGAADEVVADGDVALCVPADVDFDAVAEAHPSGGIVEEDASADEVEAAAGDGGARLGLNAIVPESDDGDVVDVAVGAEDAAVGSRSEAQGA